jgi:hypothetical protein
VPLTKTWTEVVWALPQDLVTEGEILTLHLAHSARLAPFEATDGSSSDRRELAAAYDRLCVTTE